MEVSGYTIPSKGMGTDFAKSQEDREFSPYILNRFINLTGASERRLGFTALTTPIAGSPNLTRLHEYIAKNGNITLMASDQNGNIYRYNGTDWSIARSGLAVNQRILSVQDDDKMIFYNGTDRNIYTDDGGVTFKDVTSRMSSGKTGGTTNTTTLQDGDVPDFSALFVTNNDIVFNVTRNAYGVISNVSTATLTHTVIGTAGTGLGLAAANQTTNDTYVILDSLANNVIDIGGGIYDNVALSGGATNTTTISVHGVNFSTTDIRVGDFIYNTTRAALTRVLTVGTNLTVVSVTAQTSGDSLVFLKDSIPITKAAHINWGRVYYMDAVNQNTVRVSGVDDPFDMTTFSNTLNASRFDFGGLQPLGDRLLAMTTFQRFFAAAGSRYVYVFGGTDPIRDISTSTTSFTPIATYPQGIVGRFALGSTGNDLLYIGNDGLTSVVISSENSSLIATNLNEFIKSGVRRAIAANTNSDNIQFIFYPRRNWIMMKIDSVIYVFNLGSVVSGSQKQGTWSLFNGSYCEMNHYFVRQNGDLIACGANGGVWLMDSSYTDNGTAITTQFDWPYLRLNDPSIDIRVKSGRYIKPYIESGAGINYTFSAIAGLDNLSNDSITIPSQGAGSIGSFVIGQTQIGASGVQDDKYPLRWRGEQVKIRVTTSSTNGPDILAGFVLYGNVGGLE
jgi:hypothetical protein